MTIGEAEAFLDTFLLEIGDEKRMDIILVPPFTTLSRVSERLSRIQLLKLGAQNTASEQRQAPIPVKSRRICCGNSLFVTSWSRA